MRIFILMLSCVMVGCHATNNSDGGLATSRDSLPPKAIVREVRDRSDGARVDVSFDDDTMHVNAVSPRGIGGARIELTSGNWPPKVVVHLSYAPGRPFGGLEGADAALEQSAPLADVPQTQLPVRKLATSGFEITSIPLTEMRVIYIHWVDFYRN